MAKTRQRDILNRLADVGEEAFTRVAGSQTTARVVETVAGMKERMDEMQKRVRGLDELERRVAKLEQTVEGLSKPKAATGSRSTGSTAKKPAAAKPKTSARTSGSTTRKRSTSS